MVPQIHFRQFYYVRHGQTDWNLIGKLQGNTDTLLNATGVAQTAEARVKLTGEPIRTICCSPLQRARRTAEIINQALSCPIVEIGGLRECHFGSREGTISNDWLNGWLLGEDTELPADVEPIEDFLARTAAAINLALDQIGPVLIVAHGGTYMPINKILPRDQQWDLPNCQPVRHDPPMFEDGDWTKINI
jgi:probable phosphoglycerate mutase